MGAEGSQGNCLPFSEDTELMLLAAGLRLYRGPGECEPEGGEEGKKGEGVQRSQVQKHFILCVRKEPLEFHLNIFESAVKVRV